MRTHGRLLLATSVLLLSVTFFVPVIGQNPAENPEHEAILRAIYDSEDFERLSGAARSMLEARFGKKDTGSLLTGDERFDPWEILKRDDWPEPLALLSNVLVNNPAADATTRDTQSESTIVLGSGSNIVVAYNDSGSFEPANPKFTGYSRSTNGGASFTDMGTLPTNPNADAGDPVLARNNATGRIYLSTLRQLSPGIQVFRSDDNGASFMPPVNAFPGNDGFLDKPWMTVQPQGPRAGNVYVSATQVQGTNPGIRFSRSMDHGTTWDPPAGLLLGTGTVHGSQVVAGRCAGFQSCTRVYVFWLDESAIPHRILMRRAVDLAPPGVNLNFDPAVLVTTLVSTGRSGDLGLNGGLRSNTWPSVAINRANGHLYAVYNDRTTGVDRADVYMRRSTDNGTTWEPAVRLNNDSGTNDQFFPAAAVTPNGRHLFVGWYDRRRDTLNNYMYEPFGVIANITIPGDPNDPGTVTFGPNFRIGTGMGPIVTYQDLNVTLDYMGDYDQAVADNNFFYYTWGDNRLPSPTVPNHLNQPDVRFTKIPVNGPGPIIDLTTGSLSGGNGNQSIEPNECNNMSLTLRNNGTAPATGVFGYLYTEKPGVTITQPSSVYPNLPVGGSAPNTTPYQISTAPGLECGMIRFFLFVFTNDGQFTIPFEWGSATTYQPAVGFHNNTVVPIPDPGTAQSQVTVSGLTTTIGWAAVSLHITHTFTYHLDVLLIAPDGTQVDLSTNNGGVNYGTGCGTGSWGPPRTTFDDFAPRQITHGPPYDGFFRPEYPVLFSIRGMPASVANGTWTLRVRNEPKEGEGVGGAIQCWSLLIAQTSCVSGSGQCPRSATQLVARRQRGVGPLDPPPPILSARRLLGR